MLFQRESEISPDTRDLLGCEPYKWKQLLGRRRGSFPNLFQDLCLDTPKLARFLK